MGSVLPNSTARDPLLWTMKTIRMANAPAIASRARRRGEPVRRRPYIADMPTSVPPAIMIATSPTPFIVPMNR
jgi:hypothetical protein